MEKKNKKKKSQGGAGQEQGMRSHRVETYQYDLPVETKKKASYEELAPYFFGKIELTNREIAQAVGLTPETVGKYRKRWLQEGISTLAVRPVVVEEVAEPTIEDKMQALFLGQLEVEEARQKNNLKKERIKAKLLAEMDEYGIDTQRLTNAQSSLIIGVLNHG